METDKIRVLMKVLEKGSLAAAAEELDYTASGVSRMIASLEEETGFPLLVRGKKGVCPTAGCEQLKPVMQELLRQTEQFREIASEIKGVQCGSITIGLSYNVLYRWISMLIAEFGKENPLIDVQLVSGSSEDLAQKLERQELDFALIGYREGCRQWSTLYRDDLVALVPRNHPCAQKGVYPLAQVEKDPYILLFPGKDNNDIRMFRQVGVTPNIRFKTGDRDAAFALVESGLGVTVVNRLNAHAADWNMTLLPLEPRQQVEVGIALSQVGGASPAVMRFLECVKKYPIQDSQI